MSEQDSQRTRLLVTALWLTAFSIAWGVISGCVSVAVGLRDGSLGVLGLGLNVLADVCGSLVLVWRFRAELRQTGDAHEAEQRAAIVVAAALGLVSVILVASTVHALAVGSRPGSSLLAVVTAGLAVAVLTPLAYAKRRVAAQLGSAALKGDGALSGIGAAVAVLALTGLALDQAFGWWWADRVAALFVAGIAAVEALRAAGLRD